MHLLDREMDSALREGDTATSLVLARKPRSERGTVEFRLANPRIL